MRRDALPAALVAAPTQLAAALSRSDAASREEILTRLQAAGGNQQVGRLIQAAPAAAGPIRPVTETIRYPFTATIRKAPGTAALPAPAGSRRGPTSRPSAAKEAHEQATLIEQAPVRSRARLGRERRGAHPRQAGGAGAGRDPGARRRTERPTPAPAQAPAAAAAPRATERRRPAAEAARPGTAGHRRPRARRSRLPDIHLPALGEVERCDALVTAFGYSGSITKGGAQPTGFGVTRSFGSSLTDLTFASRPGVYVVTATLEHPITYQIRSATGPNGETNIGSDTDSAITAANYSTVVVRPHART